eukprot:7033639-Prymnesium_polylepis.1
MYWRKRCLSSQRSSAACQSRSRTSPLEGFPRAAHGAARRRQSGWWTPRRSTPAGRKAIRSASTATGAASMW